MKTTCAYTGSASSERARRTSMRRPRSLGICSGWAPPMPNLVGRSSNFRQGRATISRSTDRRSRTPASFPAEIEDGTLVAFAVDDLVGAREELVASTAAGRSRTRFGEHALAQAGSPSPSRRSTSQPGQHTGRNVWHRLAQPCGAHSSGSQKPHEYGDHEPTVARVATLELAVTPEVAGASPVAR